jgi:arylsulfatase A-like enzyme
MYAELSKVSPGSSKANWQAGALICRAFCVAMFVALVGCASAARARSEAQAGQQTEVRRPNILFVFADDWGQYSDAYADDATRPWNRFARTPNFNRVAAEGVLFNNVFVNSPQCTPSRSALFTGQSFYRTGLAAVQDGIWDFTNPSFPMLLEAAGYHIGYTSKVWSPGTPRDAPFGGREHAYEAAGRDFDDFSEFVSGEVERGGDAREARAVLYGQVRANFGTFLADREGDEPWLYWFGARNPHRTWVKGSGQALWGIDPDDLQGNMPPFLPDVHAVREDLSDYFGEIQAFDAMLGVLLEELESTGELENTIIVVSGDHGAPGFPHGKSNLYDFGTRTVLGVRWGDRVEAGRFVDDYVDLADLAPTLLDAAGVAVPSVMNARSLMPILLSDDSGQIDPERTWVVTGRERHVATAREQNLPYPQRAIQTEDFLFIWNMRPDRWPAGSPENISSATAPDVEQLEADTFVTHPDMDGGPTKAFLVTQRNSSDFSRFYDIAFAKRPQEELYDLRIDPHQMNNVADRDEYSRVQAELRDRLLAYLRETGDPRVQGDGTRFDRMPYTFVAWDAGLEAGGHACPGAGPCGSGGQPAIAPVPPPNPAADRPIESVEED